MDTGYLGNLAAFSLNQPHPRLAGTEAQDAYYKQHAPRGLGAPLLRIFSTIGLIWFASTAFDGLLR